MNFIKQEDLRRAKDEIIFNLYLYLADFIESDTEETLGSSVAQLQLKKEQMNLRQIRQLTILQAAIKKNPSLSNTRCLATMRSSGGLNAGIFEKPNRSISVVFRGTGGGEWIDNGEGLSGIPEENTYESYNENATLRSTDIVNEDYSTDQQVEALNWFSKMAAKYGFNSQTELTVSGHSKGGNKAQFVSLFSDLVDRCYSFDGQGFSPEALSSFQKKFGTDFPRRRQKLISISAENDYVNVLGARLVPEENIYFFKSHCGIHPLDALLSESAEFYPQREQGALSKYLEQVSAEIMDMEPQKRQYATLGIMNVFQRFFGKGEPVNHDFVSIEKTLLGIVITVRQLLRKWLS